MTISRRLHHIRILIGEDCPDLQMLYADILESEGAKVEIVGNGEDVLRSIQNSVFDLVLVDVNMPKLNGIEVVRRLRQQSVSLPVLALTAEIFGKRLEDCQCAGFSKIMHKPFLSDDLIATIQNLLPAIGRLAQSEISR